MSHDHPPVVIFGCGYVGTRLAQSLLADGITVRACVRRVSLLEPLRALGAEVHYMDGARPHQYGPALGGLTRPLVVYSIPGVPDLPQGEGVRRAATASGRVGASGFIYLSSSAVYGRSELTFTEDWIDEDSSVATSDADAMVRLSDEAALQSVGQTGLRTIILRLGAIYGPTLDAHHAARGARQRLRTGQYKLWDGGRHFFSRIYIDDLVRIIRIAGEKAPPSSLYVVGDDSPCRQSEYGKWLAAHLGLPNPPEADASRSSGPRNIIRGRRLRNDKLKRELGVSLHYPSYREGELAIDAIEQGAPLPKLRLSDVPEPTQSVSPAIPPAPLLTEPATENVAPPLPVMSPWPRAALAEDLGTLLFSAPRGVALLHLRKDQQAALGPAYVLVSGSAKAVVFGRTVALPVGSAVPIGTVVTAESDSVLLALTAVAPT